MEFYPDVVVGYNCNGWKGDLYWTPSQLYKTVTIDGKVYELYLRWRHSHCLADVLLCVHLTQLSESLSKFRK